MLRHIPYIVKLSRKLSIRNDQQKQTCLVICCCFWSSLSSSEPLVNGTGVLKGIKSWHIFSWMPVQSIFWCSESLKLNIFSISLYSKSYLTVSDLSVKIDKKKEKKTKIKKEKKEIQRLEKYLRYLWCYSSTCPDKGCIPFTLVYLSQVRKSCYTALKCSHMVNSVSCYFYLCSM